MFSTNLGINFNTIVRFGIIDKTPPTPKKVPLKFVPDPKKTPCKKRAKQSTFPMFRRVQSGPYKINHLLRMVILNTLLRRWLYTPKMQVLHPKNIVYNPTKWRKRGFPWYQPASVGSFSIFPTWPPTWKYDVAPPCWRFEGGPQSPRPNKVDGL